MWCFCHLARPVLLLCLNNLLFAMHEHGCPQCEIQSVKAITHRQPAERVNMWSLQNTASANPAPEHQQ